MSTPKATRSDPFATLKEKVSILTTAGGTTLLVAFFLFGIACGGVFTRFVLDSNNSSSPPSTTTNQTTRVSAQIELPRAGTVGTADPLSLVVLSSGQLSGLTLTFPANIQVAPSSSLNTAGKLNSSFTPAKGVQAVLVAPAGCTPGAKNSLVCPAQAPGELRTLTLKLVPLSKGTLAVSAFLSTPGGPALIGIDGHPAIVAFGISVA